MQQDPEHSSRKGSPAISFQTDSDTTTPLRELRAPEVAAVANAAAPKMTSCSRSLRRTMPENLLKRTKPISPPSLSRVNGWSLPLHSFQLVAWTAYVYLTIVAFGLFIPLLPYFWRNITYIVIGILFVFHFIVHITAVTIDPADPNVRHKKSYGKPMPVLDRTKHRHVIQNQYCHLCEVTVGVKAKHCSACNKCIADFDHHCKWLNNCVGSRNYWYFFTSVASAVLGIILLIILLLHVFIQYFVNPEKLRTDLQFENYPHNVWLAFLPWLPVPTSPVVLLMIAVVTLLLSFVSLLLLGHLLGFHLYLLFRQLSTFDYMTQGRQKQGTNLQMKISAPLKSSLSKSESELSAGQKKRPQAQESCVKSSSKQKNFFLTTPPLGNRRLCVGVNEGLSQTCFTLMTAISTDKCNNQPQKKKQDKSEGTTEKKEQNASSSEESLNSELFSAILPGSPKLDSLMALYSPSSTQQSPSSGELLKAIQKQKCASTHSEPNASLLTSKEKN
ncbi:palmitoyltransferase ZDHHC11-like [Trichosurus vulpecula]|uniref:palmitoyltransferase ZDHHC11-like n=1 Tax=Trichosurus vulpecula TaxID=9337 RepID=UPI00186B2225|nr:palmitoyltransferase ZDHHC11-like [Trichosurus vulpecula]